MKTTAFLALAFLLLAICGVAGCGGGGSETSDPPSAGLSGYPKGPTREFIVPGGDNAVQLFGREASVAERRQASRTIQAWMRARAASAWAKDCSYFSRAYVKTLVSDAESVTTGKVTTCPAALKYFGPNASGNLFNTLDGPIDSLRVGEGHGYAQYHGREGRDWIVPVEREHGQWRVAIAAPLNRNR